MILGIVAVLALVIPLFLTIWWYHIFFSYRRYLKKFPVMSQLPLLGAINRVRNTTEIYDMFLFECKKFGRNIFAMLGPFPTLFTSDPKLFSLILGSPKHVNKPILYEIAMGNSLRNTLLFVNGNEWKRQRKCLNPAFDYGSLKGTIPIFNKNSEGLVRILYDKTNEESTEICDILREWSVMVSFETMLGNDSSSNDKSIVIEGIECLVKIFMEKATRIISYINATYMFTRNYWLEKKWFRFFFDYVQDLIEKKKVEMKSETSDHQRNKPLLIDILLKLMETDENITESFIERQLALMLGTGIETTSMTISFLLYHLSLNPEIQQKAYEEVFSILGKDMTEPITHRHLSDMVYLDLVVKESMRMKTTVPFFLRQLDEDVDFEGTILPKGLTIMFLHYVMHLDPEIYPDPDKFIPERFLPENLNSNKYSYTPFCGGVRNCIGYKYVMLLMKIVLAKILLNYKLVDAKHELRLTPEITLRSITGIKIGFRRRV